MNDLTNITTGEVRLSYVHLFKPYAYQPGQEEKFSCTILVPKTDTDTKSICNFFQLLNLRVSDSVLVFFYRRRIDIGKLTEFFLR